MRKQLSKMSNMTFENDARLRSFLNLQIGARAFQISVEAVF